MYIRDVVVENVKSFRGSQRFRLKGGVNYFVGDNNSGKSTVLEAILFIFDRPTSDRWAPDRFYAKDADGPTRVQVDIAGDVDDLVAQEKFKKLADFVFEDDGERVLRLERSSQEREVQQGGKGKKVDVKAVCFWHPQRNQFENVTGIDALVKGMFDFEAVWADARPGDTIDFSSNKTLGRLLDASFQKFVKTELWRALASAHSQAFSGDEDESFIAETNKLATGIKELVDEQYGSAEFRFDFGLPDVSIFMKQGRLQVDDGAGETSVEDKGTGMQRAIALAVIQLYARSAALASQTSVKPLVLMLDEPETWLHPMAQLKLGDALNRIGECEQVFIVTHSPYLIRKFDAKNHLLTVLSGKGKDRRCDNSTTFGLFGVGEPTWGEINYRAFGVCSNDFHNELYGCVQRYLEKELDGKRAKEKDIDDFLASRELTRSKTWKRTADRTDSVTLPVYVRNSIHHPENSLNDEVNNEELLRATEMLVSVVEWINAQPGDPPTA